MRVIALTNASFLFVIAEGNLPLPLFLPLLLPLSLLMLVKGKGKSKSGFPPEMTSKVEQAKAKAETANTIYMSIRPG